jgi:hypothetical protein
MVIVFKNKQLCYGISFLIAKYTLTAWQPQKIRILLLVSSDTATSELRIKNSVWMYIINSHTDLS